jgi:hypothetical protein
LVRLEDVQKHRNALRLGSTDWGDFLGGLREYDFFTIDPEKKVTLVYGTPEFERLNDEYFVSLLELVGDEGRSGLVTRIVELRHGGASPDDKRPRIFLAHGTPDLNKDRRMLRDYLEAEGYSVVPNKSFYNASTQLLAEIQAALRNSLLFIQVLGRFHYDATEAFPEGYEAWQLARAREFKGSNI